jgi:addiction module HigA family antidote
MTIAIEELDRLDFSELAAGEKIPFPLPGQILLEDFLKPLGITQYRLAKDIGVPQRRIGEIIAGKRAITVDTGLRLSRYFGVNDNFWTGLQLNYDTRQAKQALKHVLTAIHRYDSAA